ASTSGGGTRRSARRSAPWGSPTSTPTSSPSRRGPSGRRAPRACGRHGPPGTPSSSSTAAARRRSGGSPDATGERGVPVTRTAYLDHPGPVPLAHRGCSTDGLENSMAAFQAAVDLGFRYLETDVHATADGVLLAFHDASLDRVTDMNGEIARLPWSTVARARIGGVEPIPRLEDVLGTWPQVRVNIDVKSAG